MTKHAQQPFSSGHQSSAKQPAVPLVVKGLLWIVGIYLFLAIVLFPLLYCLVGLTGQEHESFFDCLYFSVVTMTGTGFGDILPQGYARLVAAVQMLILCPVLPIALGWVFWSASRQQ